MRISGASLAKKQKKHNNCIVCSYFRIMFVHPFQLQPSLADVSGFQRFHFQFRGFNFSLFASGDSKVELCWSLFLQILLRISQISRLARRRFGVSAFSFFTVGVSNFFIFQFRRFQRRIVLVPFFYIWHRISQISPLVRRRFGVSVAWNSASIRGICLHYYCSGRRSPGWTRHVRVCIDRRRFVVELLGPATGDERPNQSGTRHTVEIGRHLSIGCPPCSKRLGSRLVGGGVEAGRGAGRWRP